MPRALGPIIRTLIFTILVPGFVAVFVPHWLAGSALKPTLGTIELVGIVLIGLGAAIYFRCAWDFAYHGLGTPAPIDPPKILVSRGLHRFVRNPMYVGVLSVVFGQAALFRSVRILIYGVCLRLLFHFFVVLYEEPTLRKQFGREYEVYCKAVPRWMPRV